MIARRTDHHCASLYLPVWSLQCPVVAERSDHDHTTAADEGDERGDLREGFMPLKSAPKSSYIPA